MREGGLCSTDEVHRGFVLIWCPHALLSKLSLHLSKISRQALSIVQKIVQGRIGAAETLQQNLVCLTLILLFLRRGKGGALQMFATRDIAAGEEVVNNYGELSQVGAVLFLYFLCFCFLIQCTIFYSICSLGEPFFICIVTTHKPGRDGVL